MMSTLLKMQRVLIFIGGPVLVALTLAMSLLSSNSINRYRLSPSGFMNPHHVHAAVMSLLFAPTAGYARHPNQVALTSHDPTQVTSALGLVLLGIVSPHGGGTITLWHGHSPLVSWNHHPTPSAIWAGHSAMVAIQSGRHVPVADGGRNIWHNHRTPLAWVDHPASMTVWNHHVVRRAMWTRYGQMTVRVGRPAPVAILPRRSAPVVEGREKIWHQHASLTIWHGRAQVVGSERNLQSYHPVQVAEGGIKVWHQHASLTIWHGHALVAVQTGCHVPMTEGEENVWHDHVQITIWAGHSTQGTNRNIQTGHHAQMAGGREHIQTGHPIQIDMWSGHPVSMAIQSAHSAQKAIEKGKLWVGHHTSMAGDGRNRVAIWNSHQAQVTAWSRHSESAARSGGNIWNNHHPPLVWSHHPAPVAIQNGDYTQGADESGNIWHNR